MKMVKVYNKAGDEILACEVDLDRYEQIGWTPVKDKPKAKPLAKEETE
jgi:hypothetical protein